MYLQLNLKGWDADKIRNNFRDECPIIAFILDEWKKNSDTSSKDKLLIYPPRGQNLRHNDEDNDFRTTFTFWSGENVYVIEGHVIGGPPHI
jgi:hypothetical protein